MLPEKPIVWMHGEVKTPPFSSRARVEAGVLLRRLQRGEKLGLPDSRPMPAIGVSCHELRIADAGKAWRIVYYIGAQAIVILEVFEKKTRATPKRVIDAAQRRLKIFRGLEKET